MHRQNPNPLIPNVERGSTKAMTRLLSIDEAAAAIGYTPQGLRKIIDRSRAKAAGANTRGPTIKFFQTHKGAPIKFKPEWLEEFIRQHTIDPWQAKRRTPNRHAARPTPAAKPLVDGIPLGFDPALLADND